MKPKKQIVKDTYKFEDDELKVLNLTSDEELKKLAKAEQQLLELGEVIGSAMDEEDGFLFDEDCGTLKAHRNSIKTYNDSRKQSKLAVQIVTTTQESAEETQTSESGIMQQELDLDVPEPKRKRSLFELLEGDDE